MNPNEQSSTVNKVIMGCVAILRMVFKVKNRLGWAALLIALGASMPWNSPFPWLWIVAGFGLILNSIVVVAKGMDDAGLSSACPRLTTVVLTLAPIVIVSATSAAV